MVDLPPIKQDIDIDTSDLAAAVVEAKAFASAMDKALKIDNSKLKQALADMRRDMSGLDDDATRTGTSINNLGQSVQGLSTRINAARSGLQNLRQDLTNLNRETDGLADNLGKIATNIDKVSDSAKRSNTNLRGMSTSLRDIKNNAAGSNTALGSLRGSFDDLGDSLDRNNQGMRDYADNLERIRNANNNGNGPEGSPIPDASNADRAGHQINDLSDEIARLSRVVTESSEAVRKFNEQVDRTGGSGNDEEIARLREELEQVRNAAAESAAAARAAGSSYDKMGDQARGAAGGVGALAAATALLNAAMSTSFVTSILKAGTGIGALLGAVGVVGAAIGQLTAGVFGLAASIGEILPLAAAIPAAIAGVAVLGITLKAALSTKGVENQYAKELQKTKDKVSELGKAVQTVIQEQTTPAFVGLFNAILNMQPAIENGFRHVASGLAQVVNQLTDFISSSKFQEQFQQLMESAGRQVEDFGHAAVTSIGSFTTISVAAIPIAEKFSGTVAYLADKFRALTDRAGAAKEDSLSALFDRAYETARRFGNVLIDITRGFTDLNRMGRSVGLDESILSSFERGAKGLRNFAATYKNELTETFTNAKGTFDSLGQVISQLGRTIMLDLGRINIAPLISSLAPLVDLIGKLAVPLGNSLASGLTGIFKAIADARGPLQNVAELFSGFLDVLGRFGATAIPAIIGPLQKISVAVVDFGRTFVRELGNLVPAVAEPFAQVVKSASGMMQNLVRAIEPIVSMLAQPVANALGIVQDNIGKTATQITGPLQSALAQVLPAASDAFKDLIPPISDLVVKVFELVAAFGDSFGGAITGAVAVVTPIVSLLTNLATAAAGLPEPLKAVVTGLLAFRLLSGVFGPLTTGIGNFAGGVTRMVTSIGASGGAAAAIGGLKTAMGGLLSFFGGPWGLVLAGATVAMVLFGQAQQNAKQEEAEHQAQLASLRDTLDQVTGAVTQLTVKKIGKDLIDKGLVDDLAKLGKTTGETALAISQGGKSFENFRKTTVDSFTAATDAGTKFQEAVDSNSKGVGGLLRNFADRAGVSIKDIAAAWASGGAAYDALAQRIATATGASVSNVKGSLEVIRDVANDTTGGLASGLTAVGDATQDLATASAQVRQEFETMAGSAGSALRNIEGFANVTDKQLIGALDKAHAKGIPVSEALKEIGVTGIGAATVIGTFGDAIDSSSGKLTGFGSDAEKLHDALIKIQDTANEGIPGAEKLAEAFQKMGDQASTAADKARALQDILDIMNGKVKDSQAANFDWAEGLRDVGKKMVDLETAQAGFVQSVNDSNGALDVNNTQHNEFRKTLEGMQGDYAAVNASVYQNTKASSGQAAALDAVYQSAINQKQAFKDTLTGLGLNAEAAQKLADTYLGFPTDVKTAFSLDGTDELVQKQIAGIIASIENVPEGEVTIKPGEATDETIKKLKDMGYSITTLPTGELVIHDNTATVNTEVERLRTLASQSINGTMEIDSATTTTEALNALDGLNFQVTHLPNGKVVITSDAAIAQAEVDSLIAQVGAIDATPGTVIIDSKTATADGLKRVAELGFSVTSIPDGRVRITDNTPETKSNVASVVRDLNGIPKNTPVTVTALTSAAEKILTDLGYKVTHMPNGTTTVTATANTGSAESAIASLTRPRTVTVTPRVVGGSLAAVANGAILAPMAQGGILRRPIPMAQGGLTSLSGMVARAAKMSNAHAQIVPPNTPRLIGDNMTWPELYAPLNPTSGRSINLIRQGAWRMGFELVRRNQQRAIGFAEGGIANSRQELQSAGAALNRALSSNVLISAMAARDAGMTEIVQKQNRLIQGLAQVVTARTTPTDASPGKGPVSFTFNQYNPQAIPADEMVNKGLQLAAAAGLIGGN